MRTRKKLILALMCAHALPMLAATPTDFSGVWQFNAAKTKNIGMMSEMTIAATVTQSPSMLTVTYESTFGDRKDKNEHRFDLNGKPVANVSQMAGPSETVTHWAENELVTVRTSEGAVAGTKVTRTETWALSPDKTTLTVTSQRGTAAPVVVVYDKRKQ